MEQNKRLFNSLYAVPLHLPALRTASIAPLMQLKRQNGERAGDVFSQIAFSSPCMLLRALQSREVLL